MSGIKGKNTGDKNGQYLHGLYGTRLNVIWNGMMQRCHNSNIVSDKWKSYGGRGIKVCDRWHIFANFNEDMKASYKDGLSLDRIDNNGHYCKENCRWATMNEQANNRRNNNTITYRGQTLSISKWAVRTGLSWSTIDRRKKRGLSPKDIFKKIEDPQYHHFDKDENKYRVIVKGKDLGRFNTKKEAIKARDSYVQKGLSIYNKIK